jgi:hypothetical protein
MDLNDADCTLILAGLYELCITRADDDLLLRRVRSLVIRLGGDPDAVFFNA